MTNEEAIEVIKSHIEHWEMVLWTVLHDKEECETNIQAFRMAIAALNCVDKIEKITHVENAEDLKDMGSEEAILALFKTVLNQTVVEDCVSRQEVIDMATMAINGSAYFGYPTLTQFIDYIKRLSSVKGESE